MPRSARRPPAQMSSTIRLLRRQCERPMLALTRFYTQPTSSSSASGTAQIYDRLKNKFTPSQLDVQDISGGCGDFYAVVIESPMFKGLTTLKQHKMVQEELKDIIKNIHGIQLKTMQS